LEQHAVADEMFSAYRTWAMDGDAGKLLAFMKTHAFKAVFGDGSSASHKEQVSIFSIRNKWIKTFGFSVPLPSGIEAINSLGPILEIAAGTGFLSKLISATGGDAIATDVAPLSHCAKRTRTGTHTGREPGREPGREAEAESAQPFLPIRKVDAKTAIADDRGERSILLSWPSYDLDWCEDALHAIFPGQNLALVGEGYGGCTGTDRMFEILEEDFVSFSRIGGAPRPGGASFKEIAQKGAKGFARFPGINDRLKFYRKK